MQDERADQHEAQQPQEVRCGAGAARAARGGTRRSRRCRSSPSTDAEVHLQVADHVDDDEADADDAGDRHHVLLADGRRVEVDEERLALPRRVGRAGDRPSGDRLRHAANANRARPPSLNLRIRLRRLGQTVSGRSGRRRRSGKPFSHRRRDPRRAFGHVRPGVLVHGEPDVLELVAPLRVAAPFGRRRVTHSTADLDDEAVVAEQEVDPPDVPAITPLDDLGLRPRQPGVAEQPEEPPLEDGLPAAVDEQPVEPAGAPPTAAA